MTQADNWKRIKLVSRSRLFRLLVFGSLFILSRIPLLNHGFGLDPDAWRIANTAFDFRYHMQYHASRFPGYPVPEFLSALVIDHGWLATNGLTLLLALLSVFAFSHVLKIINHRQRILVTITYAFLPILWINSANTMDYTWALCFVMLTWLCVLRKHWVVAGLMMALAIGSRMSTLILVLPFWYLCYIEGRDMGSGLKFLLSTIVITLLFYTPLFLTYGLGFVKTYSTETSVLKIGYLAIRQFGLPSIIVLLVILTLSHRQLHKVIALNDRHMIFALLAVLCGVVVFVVMPYHIEYVITLIPFLLLVIYRVGKKPLLLLLSILAVSHAFVTFINVEHRERGRIRTSLFEQGMVFRNMAARNEQLEFAKRLIESPIQTHSTVIIGSWLPLVANLDENASSVREAKRMYDPNQPGESVRNFGRGISYRYLLDLPELQQLIKEENNIYYINGIREFTIEVYGYDLADFRTVHLKI